MSTALFTDLSSYFNNIDPEDPIYQRELLRPAEIKEDVKLMEQRKRVSNIMRSKLFKKDLENIFTKYQFDNDDDNENAGISLSNLSLADISQQLLLSAIPKNKIANLSQLTHRKGLICVNDLNASINSSLYGRIERSSRCKLAAIFRLIDMYGWNSNFNSVMTARPFTDKDQFLINPFGLLFHEITASSLISVDFKGNILDFGSTVLEANPLAWMIHSAIYSCQNSIRAIFELKTPAAIAISSLEHRLLPICREAILLGPTVVLDNLPRFVSESKSTSLIMTDLNNYLTSMIVPNSKILIVPNCGFLICGEYIEEAWHLLMNCQIACETQMKLGNLTIEDLYIPDKNCQSDLFYQWRSTDLGGVTKIEINSVSHENSEHVPPAIWRIGELEFEALMRHMDNNGYRTGYIYRQENIYQSDKSLKLAGEKTKYEVEIPPSSISTIDQIKSTEIADDNRANKSFIRGKSEKWFNTPNTYKLIEDNDGIVDNNISFNFASVQSDRKSARWASAKVPTLSTSIPQHPVTAGAYVAIGHHHPSKSDSNKDRNISKINPKELLENQKRVKNKYYYDTNTAGPISCLLDSGLSREEARMIKNESLKKHLNPNSVSPNDQVVTSASKGIIQRGHKALVYQDLFKSSNPFDVTADELAAYHNEVDRKLHPERYKSVEIQQKDQNKDENPEIKITISQNESSLPSPENDAADASSSRRDTGLTSDSDLPNFQNQKEPNNSVECHPFFQSDFDEDFNNLKLIDSVCNSTPLNENGPNDDGNIKQGIVVPPNLSDDNTQLRHDEGDASKSATLKESKRKSFRSFSFKRLGKSKSLRESADILENKSATLAAPGYGTITSETSGVDISNDELDKDNKSKKKKRKFKLPSFSKKKKDKSKDK